MSATYPNLVVPLGGVGGVGGVGIIANSLPYTNAAILTALQSIKYSYKYPGYFGSALSQNNLLKLKNISPCHGNYLFGAIMKKSHNGHHAMKRSCKYI